MSSGPFSFAHDLWKHRELIWQFTLRNVELRHKGSHLGLAWSFLNPLLMLGLYVFVFGFIFGGSFGVIPGETKTDYALGVFLGLTLFHFCSEVLATSPAIIISNPNFVKKIVFPLEILPVASIGAALFHLLISLSFVIISLLLAGHSVDSRLLWLPVILFPVILLFLGVSWLLAAVGVFLRDIAQGMQFLTMALMFSSAVFYSTAKIPPLAWLYLRYNPVLLSIELARDAVLWNRPLNFNHLGYLYVVGFAGCWLGHFAFKKMRPAFSDVL